MWMQKKRTTKGFSIVEMMVVIVVIGLLGTLALSRYYAFIAKARQAEARMNLKTIADLQESWKYEKESYNSLSATHGVGAFASNPKTRCASTHAGRHLKNELGFRPKDCSKLRYGYWWSTTVGTAKSRPSGSNSELVYPDCGQYDEWEVTFSTGNINNNSDVIKKCDD